MDVIQLIFDIIVRLPMWLLLSLPVLIIIFLIAKYLKSKKITSNSVTILFTLFATFFIFPMPATMFMAFAPNFLYMFSGSGAGFYLHNLDYVIISYPLTGLLVYFFLSRYMQYAPNKPNTE